MPILTSTAPMLPHLTATIGLVLLYTLSGHAAPHPAAPTRAAKTASPPAPLAWLPPAAKTQAAVFDALASHMGEVPPDPEPPDSGIVVWALARYRTAPDQPKARYALVYQDLSLAQQRLNTPDLTKQREGLRLASNAQLCVLTQLQDKRLYARIYEGFLLPYLTAAYPQKWQDISRQRIVEAAAGAYAGIGETDKEIGLLRYYLGLTAHAAAERDDADWARAQLAGALAGQGHYAEAIQNLQAIQTANFAARQMISVYQEQWNQQKQQSSHHPAISRGDNQ